MRSKPGFFVLFVIFLIVGNTWPARSQVQDVDNQPRLVVRVVVEQMRYEMLLRYWDQFESDGFKKLAGQGVMCKNARLGYSHSGLASGLATLSTGSCPSMHGIIADKWYDRLTAQEKGAVETHSPQALGGQAENGHYAPVNLLTSSSGDELKMLNPHSQVYSVGLNATSAVLGAGKMSDGAFWMDEHSGNWMTNTYYMDSLPGWVRRFNDKDLESIYMERKWKKLKSDDYYHSAIRDDRDSEEGFLLLYSNTFPYDLQTLKRKANGFKYLKYTPFGNTYTKDFALSLIRNQQLGQDRHPDIINIAFSASAHITRLFGPRSLEMEDLYLRLDREIAHLLDYLEQQVGRENLLLVLTSAQGAADSYGYRKAKKLSAGQYKPNHGLALLKSYLNVVYEPGEWISGYAGGQIYLNHSLIDQKGYDIDQFQERVARFMVKKSGVAYAIKASAIKSGSYMGGMMKMVRKSYHPARSGDVFLVLRAGTQEQPGGSGSIYSYHTHLPMIWWGNGFEPGVVNAKVHLRDVAPTISQLLNIPYPEASFGKAILPLVEPQYSNP